jgi:hypothetical protein
LTTAASAGMCAIWRSAASASVKVSIYYAASSGKVIAKNRRLYLMVLPF